MRRRVPRCEGKPEAAAGNSPPPPVAHSAIHQSECGSAPRARRIGARWVPNREAAGHGGVAGGVMAALWWAHGGLMACSGANCYRPQGLGLEVSPSQALERVAMFIIRVCDRVGGNKGTPKSPQCVLAPLCAEELFISSRRVSAVTLSHVGFGNGRGS